MSRIKDLSPDEMVQFLNTYVANHAELDDETTDALIQISIWIQVVKSIMESRWRR